MRMNLKRRVAKSGELSGETSLKNDLWSLGLHTCGRDRNTLDNLKRSFYRHIALPLVDLARRTDSIAAFRELDETQWWSRQELLALQFERLRRVLIHAEARVPYYRRLFASVGFDSSRIETPLDIRSIPFLTKRILRSERNQLLSDNLREFQPRIHRSAGTTGQPIAIQMDRSRHSIGWADMYRWWSAGGWNLGDKQYVVAGAALRPRSISGLRARIYSKLNHFEDYTAFDLNEDAMDRLLERIDGNGESVFIRGYASSIAKLALHAKTRKWSGRVGAVFTTAETLFPEQRNLIQSALHGPVFDQWGCRDGGISAFECEAHHGLHLAVENAYVEIIKDGRPAEPGEAGEVVATDLFSYGMPMIRYRVGDVATLSTNPCPCGRGLPLIESVQGRVSGFLIGSGGRMIHGEYFSHVFWETPWVKEFQILQEVVSEIVVKLVVSDEPPHMQLQEIVDLMRSQVGAGIDIRIEFVADIPPGPMGKRQFVICRVPQ